MNFGAARLGFWFIRQGIGFNPPPQDNPFYYWSSNQLPAQPGTFAQLNFDPNGTVYVTTTSTAIPLFDLPLTWKQNSEPGSSYEMRALINVVNQDGDAFYKFFGLPNDFPTVGNDTPWYNLGSLRTIRVEIPSGGGNTDQVGVNFDLEIGLAGTSTALITNNFSLDIGII